MEKNKDCTIPWRSFFFSSLQFLRYSHQPRRALQEVTKERRRPQLCVCAAHVSSAAAIFFVIRHLFPRQRYIRLQLRLKLVRDRNACMSELTL